MPRDPLNGRDVLKPLLFLPALRGGGDAALLLLRLVVGAFLIWGVWDNIVSAARMAEFVGFLTQFKFAYPEIMAPLSVYAQFLCGAAFILGLLTRWAGWVCVINFIVAVVMVDAAGGIRAAFPATMLILVGAYLGTYGAGRFSLDALLMRDRT